MDPNAARDSRYNLNYSMSMMSETPEIYGNPNVSLARPPSGGLVGQVMSRGGSLMSGNGPQCGTGGGGGGGGGGGSLSRGIKRANSDCYDDGRQMVGSQNMTGLEGCNVGSDVVDESYTSLQPKKSPPSNGKKTKGRVKIKMEYIDNKLRRYTTFSKRKTGIMKKVGGFFFVLVGAFSGSKHSGSAELECICFGVRGNRGENCQNQLVSTAARSMELGDFYNKI